jgi:hypothetical protein
MITRPVSSGMVGWNGIDVPPPGEALRFVPRVATAVPASWRLRE